jgi:hypothetical protein
VALVLRLCRPAGWLLVAFILANNVGELLCPGFAAELRRWLVVRSLVDTYRQGRAA